MRCAVLQFVKWTLQDWLFSLPPKKSVQPPDCEGLKVWPGFRHQGIDKNLINRTLWGLEPTEIILLTKSFTELFSEASGKRSWRDVSFDAELRRVAGLTKSLYHFKSYLSICSMHVHMFRIGKGLSLHTAIKVWSLEWWLVSTDNRV